MIHYLDNAATSRVLPAAAEAAVHMMREEFGNPSSLHKMGIEAARVLKDSREAVAAVLGGTPAETYFTSGGTESINTAIFGAARKNRHAGRHIVTTAIEHAATLNACRRLESEGFEVTYVQPTADGHILAEDMENAMREDTILVSCMLVNNEVGTVLPVTEIGRALKRKNPSALFHVDAVQGLFRLPLTPKKWNCDLLSVSGHKIGAPKGIGALYMKRDVRLAPYIVGGGQESGFRSGTEPMPQIAAFAAACRERAAQMDEDVAHVAMLKDYLTEQVNAKFDFVQWNGQGDVPHVVNLSLPGCKSEVMLRVLESKDVFVSAGSACSKGKESPVLRAMGLDKKRIDSALRISFAPFNTKEDVDALLEGLEAGVRMLRR
ncbi:cysteine desulfurase family protein [Butyricicoccus pullicaecorum]|uniref:cysteine desulfurase family protein n=1 Tax=Butyricicoccus pullicaecorum TaxID=501571 RepID=UPI003990497F